MKFTEMQKYKICKLGHSLKENLLPEPLIKLFGQLWQKNTPLLN